MNNFINSNYYDLIIILLSITGIGILMIILSLIINKKKKQLEEKNANGLNDREIKKIDKTLTREKLTNEIFSLYKEVALAKSNFDYDILKELLTKELYIKEEKNLEKLKNNNQKNIITDINLEKIKILNIKKEKTTKKIIAYLHVSQYDYVIDNKKNIVRGTKEIEYQVEYRLTIDKKPNKYFKLSNITTTGKWIKNK